MAKFQAGQNVHLRANASLAGRTGVYKIVQVLPRDGGPQRYRAKSELEAFERVLNESGLDVIN